jgi:hypothetical protein
MQTSIGARPAVAPAAAAPAACLRVEMVTASCASTLIVYGGDGIA